LSDATSDVQRMMQAARERYVTLHGNVDHNNRPLINVGQKPTAQTRPRAVRFEMSDDLDADHEPRPQFWDRASARPVTDRSAAKAAQQARVHHCTLQLMTLFR
jgi:hypothetical protein